MKYTLVTLPGLSLLAMMISQQLYAENASAPAAISVPTATFDTVVATNGKSGVLLSNRISDMPQTTQVFLQKDIQAQSTGNRQVADILAQLVPGLGVSSGTTSNFGQTMRGRQVQYLLNGVPLTGSRDISRQLNSINPNQIERIEVLSGATSIYGAGATGGLINIVTNSIVPEKPFQTRLGISTNNDANQEAFGYQVGQSVSGMTESGHLAGRLDIDYKQTGGTFDSQNNRIAPEPAQTDQQDSKSLSVNANMDWTIDEKQNLNLALTHYNDKQDTDYAPDYGKNLAVLFGQAPSKKAIKGLSLEQQPKTEKQTINLNYHHDDIAGNSFNANAYYRREKGKFYPFVVPFSVAKAVPILQSMNLTQAQLQQYSQALKSNAYGVLQSQSDIDVIGARLALQKQFDSKNPMLLTYGVDYEQEKDSQFAKGYDLKTFMQSNGLSFQEEGQNYTYGPNTTIDSLGVFANLNMDIADKWHMTAGARHQNIDSKTDSFTPLSDTLLANLLGQYKIPFTTGQVKSGKVSHDKTLFNLGASYDIDPHNSLFANFSQGYSLPDLQRVLRDVNSDFVVNSSNVEPIAVNSYDMGWSGKIGNTNAKLTGFYNTSDKVIQFLKDYSVAVADTDERVYGAELQLNHKFNDTWSAGTSMAYTRGQYKDAKGDYRELGAFRISPLKATAFAQYTSPEEHKLRLQLLAVDGTDKAYQDSLVASSDTNVRSTPEAKIKGYVTADLLGEFKLPKGKLDVGIYNLANTGYKTVFSQAAATTYGDISSLDAAGRTYGLRYTVDY